MNYRFSGIAVAASIAFSMPACGQFVQAGVEAGVPLNDVYVNGGSAGLTANTNRFIIGPKIEVHLPFRLGVEADALYRHSSFNGSGSSEWDFPILLKYRFRGIPLVNPFVDAGPIFNHVSEIMGFTPNQSAAGVALGGGLDFHVLFLHVQPEFRYVHWGSRNYDFAAAGSGLASSQNQVQFLIGFTF